MVAEAIAGLDDDQVEPERQPRHRRSIRQHAPIEQPVGGRPDADALAMVDGLLGEAEVPAGPPANLDDDERRGRTRVDRHEVELVATDMDVPGQDGPAGVRESRSDERLGGIARLLCRRSSRFAGSVRHRIILATDAHSRLTPRGRSGVLPILDTTGRTGVFIARRYSVHRASQEDPGEFPRAGGSKHPPSVVWRSLFRQPYPRDERSRAYAVMNNVFLHIHPVRVRQHAVKFAYTFCLGG